MMRLVDAEQICVTTGIKSSRAALGGAGVLEGVHQSAKQPETKQASAVIYKQLNASSMVVSFQSNRF